MSTTETSSDKPVGRAAKSRRPRGQNQRREQILDVAAKLFADKGYQATSIQDIADEVDLLKGSLYYYFESKQELLLEVARQAHTVPFDELFELLDHGTDSADKVRRYVEYFVRMICYHPITTAAFYSEMRHLEPAHAQEILEARDRHEDILENILAGGQAHGSIIDTIPPKLQARAILGLINSVARWYRPNGAWDANLVATAYGAMAAAGIRKPA